MDETIETHLYITNLIEILTSKTRSGLQYKVDKYIIGYLNIFKVIYSNNLDDNILLCKIIKI